jgi:hypothetical protein
MDFCRDGENCLIVPGDDEVAVAPAESRIIGSPRLQDDMRSGGLETAAR